MADDRPIFVISDLHMGDGGPRDNFAWGDREKQLGLFLDYVAQQQGELIVLGDLFEFWQMNLSKIITLHKPLMDRLAAMDATYVIGNHDADFDHFIGTGFLSHPLFEKMSRPFEREIGGKRFKFMHGHEVDPFNSGDTPGKGRVFCILAGMREDENKSPVLPNGEFVEDHLEEIGDVLEAIASHVKGTKSRLTGLWNRLRRLDQGNGNMRTTPYPRSKSRSGQGDACPVLRRYGRHWLRCAHCRAHSPSWAHRGLVLQQRHLGQEDEQFRPDQRRPVMRPCSIGSMVAPSATRRYWRCEELLGDRLGFQSPQRA